MSAEYITLMKMRQANVPPYAYETSLAREKLDILAADVKERTFNLGSGYYQSYAITTGAASPEASAKVTKSVAVFCKELVLVGAKVRYFSLAELMVALKKGLVSGEFADTDYEFGSGYLALGDYGLNIQNWQGNEVELLSSQLVSHMSRGGGLILGASAATLSTVRSTYSNDLTNSLSTFKIIKVA